MYRQILEHRPSSCSNNYHRAIKTQVTDPRDGPRRIRIVFLRIRIQADSILFCRIRILFTGSDTIF